MDFHRTGGMTIIGSDPEGRQSVSTITLPKPVVHYPDDDGLPMSDNTTQMRWIFTMHINLEAQYRDDPNVFVAGNHLIYPVEGDNNTKQAPDVFVAFGRPKHDRGSYNRQMPTPIGPPDTPRS